MSTVFLSDAHLRAPADPNFQRVEAFLRDPPPGTSRLVINGDFFDCWYSHNPAAEALYAPILTVLDAFHARGGEIVYIEGNHDFSLGDFFKRRGWSMHAGAWTTVIGGQRVRVEHGDLVVGDRGYHLLHKTLRSPMVEMVNRVMPPKWSLNIGLGMSRASRMRPADTEEFVNARLLAHAKTLRDVDVWITGHTHFPFDKVVEGPTGPVRAINLGDWFANFTYLRADDQGMELCRA